MSFADRVTVITGGSTGVGSGCARVFVEAGASVVITGRGRADGTSFANELNKAGPGCCEFVLCDAADFSRLRAVIDQVASDHGRLDCLVNNVGQSFGWRPIDEIDTDDFLRLLAINVGSYFAASKFALPYLRRTSGSIVNVGSIVSETGSYWSSDYAASKGAITTLTRSLAIDEAANGVRVNAVLPGNVMTQRWQASIASGDVSSELNGFVEDWPWIGRSCTPEEIGNLVLFLASGAATYLTGATFPVTGGAELGFGRKLPFGDLLRPRQSQ